MLRLMTKPLALGALICAPLLASADDLADAIQKDYDDYLGELFEHFHSNPELSFMENKTAERLAAEFREAGFEVTEGVGGTGVVALLENGPGPLVMMRADMDGLPVEEKSGLSYASKAKQVDWNGDETYVMHACGHDGHVAKAARRRPVSRRHDHQREAPVLRGREQAHAFVDGGAVQGQCPDHGAGGAGDRERRLRAGDLVCWDNINMQKNKQVLAAIEAVGASVVFLPRYSPDMNPIEAAWAKAKALIRRSMPATRRALKCAIRSALRRVTESDALGWFEYCGFNLPCL